MNAILEHMVVDAAYAVVQVRLDQLHSSIPVCLRFEFCATGISDAYYCAGESNGLEEGTYKCTD